MPKFQVISPHEPSECLRAMDEMLAHDPKFLEEALVGCTVGDHTCYAVVDATATEEARGKIPAFLRPRTRVVEVEHRTPEQIRAYHENSA